MLTTYLLTISSAWMLIMATIMEVSDGGYIATVLFKTVPVALAIALVMAAFKII